MMKTLRRNLHELLLQAIQSAFPNNPEAWAKTEITPSTQERFGHYQCNTAMKLAGLFRENPLILANTIVTHLKALPSNKTVIIASCSVFSPGFINLTLKPTVLAECIEHWVHDPYLGLGNPGKGKKIVLDFPSPNAAKEMHVGHLRSAIIGDCLSRLFELLGYEVLRLNHIGDWGTAFGMLIAHMKTCAHDVLIGIKGTHLASLMNWYREAKKRFDQDPLFKKQAQAEVVCLQQGDPQALEAWSILMTITRKAHQVLYDLLDIKVIERGESFYNPMLSEILADLEKKERIVESHGAKCLFLEGFYNKEGKPLPLMMQKSDGGFNYDTTDMAAIYHRINIEKADRIIYVTDAGQSIHFQMIFKAAQQAGYWDSERTLLNHVAFGLVLGPDGKKFKTRSGHTERLLDLLTAAIEQARALLVERGADSEDETLDEQANILGINAVKYADLSTQRTADYRFTYERMLRFEGNTAAFLMYAYVRMVSIKGKLGLSEHSLPPCCTIQLQHPSEITLALHLNQFVEVIDVLSNDLYPHRLTDYLFRLAEHFHAFFRDCRVEGDPAESSRLMLCEACRQVLLKGLNLLGLKTVNKM